MNPETPPTAPSPATPPTMPQVPTPEVQPPTPAPGPAIAQPLPPTQTKKSKKGLIIGLVVGFVVLIIALLVLGFFLLLGPLRASKSVSDSFMASLKSNDIAKAMELSGGASDDARKFLEGAAASTEGGYKNTQARLVNSTGYFLYELNTDKYKYGRVVVEKKDGNWQVVSYVYGANQLALVPADSAQPEPVTTTQTTEPAAPAAAVCVNDADVKKAYKSSAGSTDIGDELSWSVDTIFFKPDSTAYAYTVQSDNLDRLANFIKENQAKQFKITVQGKVSEAGATGSGQKLAKDRVQTVLNDIKARGASTAMFVELPPTQAANYNDTSERNVNVKITVPDPCTGTAPASGTAR